MVINGLYDNYGDVFLKSYDKARILKMVEYCACLTCLEEMQSAHNISPSSLDIFVHLVPGWASDAELAHHVVLLDGNGQHLKWVI